MPPKHRNLPRLGPEEYMGLAAVHWTYAIEDRKTGWLTTKFPGHFREILIHVCAHYYCVSPIYCLMPDHLHVMLWGISERADLNLASSFLHKYTTTSLLPARYQKQPYDHALKGKDMEHGAFEAVCFYIQENPVRSKLCATNGEYPFKGCIIPGYPDLDIGSKDYWESFWKIVHRLTAAATLQGSRARESMDQ